jgi:hypothetical protein
MNADWTAWAERCRVLPRPTPQISHQPLVVTCDVTRPATATTGVILAQGGDQRGYALYLEAGRLIFGVREERTLYTALTPTVPVGRFTVEARLSKDGAMTLAINRVVVARGKAPGLIAAQPLDPLTTNQDTLSPVGKYVTPNRFAGSVQNVSVRTGERSAVEPNSSAEAD